MVSKYVKFITLHQIDFLINCFLQNANSWKPNGNIILEIFMAAELCVRIAAVQADLEFRSCIFLITWPTYCSFFTGHDDEGIRISVQGHQTASIFSRNHNSVAGLLDR